MAIQRTLCIIKPDSVEKNRIGAILKMVEETDLTIRAMKMLRLSRPQAETFYQVHAERPFYGELVEFMTRGPVVVACLEGEDAINRYRALMGATDPAKAEDSTIRKLFGSNVGENAVHGSDSPETARFEVNYFFPGFEIG